MQELIPKTERLVSGLESRAEGYKEERVAEKLRTLFEEQKSEYSSIQMTVETLREDSELMNLAE